MKLKVVLFVTVVFAVISLIPSQTVQAQNLYGAIHGTVTDASGAVLPNARVTVVNTSTGIITRAATDSKGYFILPQLQAGGPYTVTVTASGFKSFTQSGLTLNVNDNRDVEAKLEVGSGTTTIQVSASAVQVDTSDTQLKSHGHFRTRSSSCLFSAATLRLFPKLTPGTVESSDRFGNYSANGSQTQMNSYLLDGADINDEPASAAGAHR